MAISFARLALHTRGKGHSAVAGAAYRAGVSLYDRRTGEIHDYSHRLDDIHAEILLPENTHAKFFDREFLWNEVERFENRKDAQLAKELTLALPKELNLEQHIEMIKRFAQEHFVKHGLAVDFAIHNQAGENPHAHLLITTRRLEYDQLSAQKARDLNPTFYGKSDKKVFDSWSDKWRDFQNNYFQENQIHLIVDAGYVIPTRHQGRIRNQKIPHYLKEENKLKKQLSFEMVLKRPGVVLDHLARHYATFTDREIANVVLKHTQSTADFESVLLKVKADKRLIELGYGEDGRLRYTTKGIYRQEQRLISQTLSMAGRHDKAIRGRVIDRVAKKYGLQAEQIDAVRHVMQQGDITCLVGRAGTGKTYAMKAVKALYDKKGYTVYGASISGIAAKGLEAETGIASDTIHSLAYRIEKGCFQPKPGSVIVIDEAGMVSLPEMARIVDFAKRSHCKLILLGDPDQLQPVLTGTPFRAILENVGFFEMRQIKRQKDPLDCQASMNLAAGKVGLAIDHYVSKNQFHLVDAEKVHHQLMASWTAGLSAGLENQIILAQTRAQVGELNRLARESLLEKNLVATKGKSVQTVLGTLVLAKGDRIVFLENNAKLGVYNGHFGTIERIRGRKITARVGEKSVTFDTKTYANFSYGYAVTVHKSQGATFDRVFTYLDGFGFDRSLAYVAMTRHRQSLEVFANRTYYKDLENLKRQLSRAPVRDNAIDYPLSFALRCGFDPEKTLGKALNHIAGVGHRVRDGWLFVRNYELWIQQRERKQRLQDEQVIRREANAVATFADLNQTVRLGWAQQAMNEFMDVPSELLAQTASRDRMAYEIFLKYARHEKALAANQIERADLEKYADQHLKRERIKAFQTALSDVRRGQLASEICAARKAHHPHVQTLQVDWKAVNLALWQFNQRRERLVQGERSAYETVAHYAVLRKDVAKAWARRGATHRAPNTCPNLARNEARAKGLTKQLHELAATLYEQRAFYQKALDFYKIDEAQLRKQAFKHSANLKKSPSPPNLEQALEKLKALNAGVRDFMAQFVPSKTSQKDFHLVPTAPMAANAKNEMVAELLKSPVIATLEKTAPQAVNDLKTAFYTQQLSTLQRSLLEDPAWEALSRGEGRSFKETTGLLTQIRGQIFDHLHDTAKINRLMTPVTTLFEKLIHSKSQSDELQKLAPSLYNKVHAHLPALVKTYCRGREQGLERER